MFMELTDFKIFAKIAEEGSISRAAEKLGYVQSNLTARLRKLEEELGVALFYRLPKGVTLTEKGAVFLKYSRTILHSSEEALKAVRDTPYPSGPLTIGVVETVTCGNFMNTLSEFQTLHPDVSLSILTRTSQELLAKVFNHQLDGAFVTDPSNSPQLIYEYKRKDEIVLLTKSPGAYPDLNDTKWAVFPEGDPFRRVLEEWLESEKIPLKNLIEISSLETILSCVQSGLAATLLPKSVLSGNYESLGTYTIPEKFRFTNTCMVRRKDRFSSKAFNAFAEMVREKGL